MRFKFLLILIISISFSFSAIQLDKNAVKGIYHLGIAERGAKKVMIEYGDYQGKKVIAVQASKKVAPAVYYYMEKESKEINRPVFMTSGLYLIKYDDQSFALIQPNAVLGKKPWTKFMYINLYSKNAQSAASFNRATIETFAKKLSDTIMNQEVGAMAHSAGTYYLAVPQKHSRKFQNTYTINFNTDGKKKIIIKPCDSCGESEYVHLPEESAIAGVDVYRNSTSYYLFDLKDGVLIYTFVNGGGLGKTLWGKGSNYNVYANNENYIRQIVSSKEKQGIIDEMMSTYFKDIKTEFERRAAEAKMKKDMNRELPDEGLSDSGLKAEALKAAKRWAKSWNWKEDLKDAYFTSNDWSITRNRLTGIITGKVIRGIVTMTHPDGRCRFQNVSFRMDYDGSTYTNLHMTGVGPIYDLQCGKI